MPVYNGERYLAEAIESILGQTLSDLELIIVDDCSTDGSVAIIRDYAERDERVRMIQHERNLGEGPTRNSGIAASRGEFIAVMDCDDVSLPQRLEKQVDFLQSHPDIGLVGTCVQQVKKDLTAPSFREYPQQHALIVWRWGFGIRAVGGATFLARRETLISAGGYKQSRIIMPDHELFSRLFWQTRFANLSEALYLYRFHENQITKTRADELQLADIALRHDWLSCLLGDAPRDSIDRLERMRRGKKFGWRERRLLRRDVERLIDALVAAKILVASDMPLIEAEMNKRLESTTPRLWQMFLHWRRHRFGR